MKSQTLESESPKTSKQKALLEMLSPLQCHSQVYDGTLGLICFKLGNIASWQSINPDEPLWWMFEFKKILLWAPLNVCFRKFGCQSSREFLLGRINFEANQPCSCFVFCSKTLDNWAISCWPITNYNTAVIECHDTCQPNQNLITTGAISYGAQSSSENLPFQHDFLASLSPRPWLWIDSYKVIFTLPTWYVFGSLKRGKKYLQGEWIRKATKHQEPKNNHYLGAAGTAHFFFSFHKYQTILFSPFIF